MTNASDSKLDVLIVDHDTEVRVRLRHAANSVLRFGDVFHTNSPQAAMTVLESGQMHPNLVFISYAFSPDVCNSFIQRSKSTPGGEDAAFVMILGMRDEANATVANSIFAGADGFLFEPYSIDDLVNMSKLAARVRKERRAAREALAVKFLVKDIIKYFGVMYRFAVAGCEYIQAKTKLKEICAKLHDMQPEAREHYYAVATDMFILTPAPDPSIKQLPFRSRNERARKKLEERVLNNLDRQSRNETEYGTKLKELPPPGKPRD